MIGGIAVVLAAAVAPPQSPSDPVLEAPADEQEGVPLVMSREDATLAIEGALDYLIERQNDDGSWGDDAPTLMELGFALNSFRAWRMATQGIVCMALLAGPETPDRRETLDAAAHWLATAEIPARDSDWDIDYVWTALYGFVGCVHLLEDPRFADDEDVRRRANEFFAILESHQAASGGWAYYDDPPFNVQPTWATSFCTALVLPALDRADGVGLEVDESIVQRATRYLELCVVPGGAYSYDLSPVTRIRGVESINLIEGSLGRTQVGNWARRELGDRRVTDEVVREGLDAFFREHGYLDHVRLRPIPHEGFHANAGYFYFFAHYYAAKAISLLPEDERADYHARLRPHLIKTQRESGASSDFLDTEYLVNASTAFLVLALNEGLPSREPKGER
ncbi:MAG: hypothetical protein AAGA20_08035 [Planctomycetota bacterium]